jgi:hypothetical protein
VAVGASAPAPSSSKDVCNGASYTNRIDNKGKPRGWAGMHRGCSSCVADEAARIVTAMCSSSSPSHSRRCWHSEQVSLYQPVDWLCKRCRFISAVHPVEQVSVHDTAYVCVCCLLQPAGYYDWCVVPGTSYDVVLFGGLAVVLACLLQSKLNTLMVLAAGGCIQWPGHCGPCVCVGA